MNIYSIPLLISSICFFSLGTYVFRSKLSIVNFLFFLFCLSTFIWQGSYTILLNSENPSYANLFAKLGYTGVIFLPAFYYHFFSSFLRKRRILALILSYSISFFFLYCDIFTTYFINGLHKYYFGFYPKAGKIHFLFIIDIVILFSLVLYDLSAEIKTESDERRKYQLKYLIISLVFYSLCSVDFFGNYGFKFYPFGFIAILISLGIIGYTIVKHQLMDINIVIKKTFSYSMVLLMLIVPSFIVLIVSEKYLPRDLHYPILAGLFVLVGLIFPRIKVQAERNLETILFKGVFDYKEALDNLSKRMATLLNIDELLSMATRTIARAIDTNNFGVYLSLDNGRFALKSFYGKEEPKTTEIGNESKLIHFMSASDDVLLRGKEKAPENNHAKASLDKELFNLGAKLCIPIKFENELRGFLVAAEKQSAGDYSREEMKVLSTMANQLAVAIENSLRYEEINKLNVNLEGYVREIEELNAGLEQKVEERTEELRKANEELKELDRLKTEFFSNVSHELRTPLTNIILPIQNVLQEYGEKLHPDNVSEKKAILRNANRLMKRINELLDFSRLEAGRINFRARERNLNSILDDIIAASKIGADQMGIALHFNPQPDLPKAWVDEEKIEKVFVNLIGNALKFTNSGGQVWITTMTGEVSLEEKSIQGVICRVKDTGMGIREEELPHIFERFRQADGTASRKYEGTGLGLFLVKEFIDLHHGGIEVVSTVGEGSEFIVKLRLGRDHFLPEEVIFDVSEIEGFEKRRRQTEDRRKKERRSGYDRRLGNRDDQDTISFMQVQLSDLDYNRNRDSESVPLPLQEENQQRILIVEDNQDLADNITRCLMASHYNVYVTYNGAQALARLKDELPDLIVSDVMMPEMDGNELCRRVKEDERTQHIPIVLLTARAALSDKISGLKQGADHYLAKPFNPMELLAVAESLLTQRKLHAQLGKTLQELKETQVQLVHTARMEAVGQLAAGLAHEVKNKMYCVRAGFEGINQRLAMLHEGKIRIEDIYDRLVKAMKTNSEALENSLNLVNTLLDFSRKNKETIGDMVAADINKGIEDTLAIVVPMVREKINVQTELAEVPQVVCIIEEINQVIMNLVINAYQAMTKPGLVLISTRHEDDKVLITVSDNGPGIPVEHMDKIFSPFFSTKEEGENSGLGLSICYSIIKTHHGGIEVKSDPGQGAVFIVSLPVSQPKSVENAL